MRGFTLIELAISITIIAALTFGILKGQALIDSSRVQDATKKAQDLMESVNSFRSKYKLFPGDMPNPPIADLSDDCEDGGDGNGVINAAESACIPELLYKSGIIGIMDTSSEPHSIQSHYGPVIAISRQFSNINFPATVQHVIELHNLPCEATRSIDRNIDNNDISTGRIISSAPDCESGSITPFLGIAF